MVAFCQMVTIHTSFLPGRDINPQAIFAPRRLWHNIWSLHSPGAEAESCLCLSRPLGECHRFRATVILVIHGWLYHGPQHGAAGLRSILTWCFPQCCSWHLPHLSYWDGSINPTQISVYINIFTSNLCNSILEYWHSEGDYLGMGIINFWGFPGGSVVKNLPANAGDTGDVGSIPGLERFPWIMKWQPILVFLPGKSHGQKWATVCRIAKSWTWLGMLAHSVISFYG